MTAPQSDQNQNNTNIDTRIAWQNVQAQWRLDDAIFLGTTQETPWFALTVQECSGSALSYPVGIDPSAAEVHSGIPTSTQFADLRTLGAQLNADDAALLAYAKGLSFWHSRTHYCTLCASKLQNSNGGHVKQCSNDTCKQQIFPRTDPAVIMLVTRVDADGVEHCLLGRSSIWPQGMYSTLAGFVEPGESLEHAVAREVYEESGIRVDNVRYLASQPWPFPRSIMLGFTANATNHHISLDKDELEDAQWFTREDLMSFGRWGDSNYRYQLPRGDSIASYLIHHWLENQ